MKKFAMMVAATLSLCASTAQAQLWASAKFAAYEGKDAIQEGRGGTKVVKDGVEFWTSGAPPHRYRVLGVISDKRGSGLLSGNAVGSGSVAAMVKDLGGSGVIVADEDSRVTGAVVSNGVVAVARKRTTQLIVVRYEDLEPAAAK